MTQFERKADAGFLRTAGIVLFMLALACLLGIGKAHATEATGSMAYARMSHKSAKLADGRILVIGGLTTSSSSSVTASAEIYDPATGTFSLTGSMLTARQQAGITTLNDGRVLVVGGIGYSAGATVTLNSAEIFDPVTGTWSATGTMNAARQNPSAFTLPDGRVLIVSSLASTEIYDPATGLFTPSGSLSASRSAFAAAALSDGRVLVSGGLASSGYTASSEIWNPATGTWAATGPMSTARYGASANLLSNGKVLVAGGYSNSGAVASAELYDPASGTFSPTGSMAAARYNHFSVGLSASTVAVATGAASPNDTAIELYDVATGTWRYAASLTYTRSGATIAALPNGSALFAGGSGGPYNNAEIFNPVCAVTATRLSPNAANFPGSGGAGSVNINIPAGCAWRVSRYPAWMTLTSASSGVGSGTLSYAIASSTITRGAVARIADVDFTLNQTASCDPSYVPSISPASANVGYTAGSGSFYLSHGSGCTWTVSNVPSWVTITSGLSGQGTANIYYTYAQNTGAARSATINVAGKTYTLNQSAAGVTCPAGSFASLSSSGQSFTSSGGNGSVNVYHNAGCSWSINMATVPSWITITSPTGATGNGTVTYSVASNTAAARGASLDIAGLAYVVNQQEVPAGGGSGGACAAVNLPAGSTISGTLATTDCTSGARGTSYYTDRYNFVATGGQQIAIYVSSSAFDTYIYLKDPNGNVIASNDDGGGGTNSRIPAPSGYFTLPAGPQGTYVVEVTSYGQRSTGAYSINRSQ